MTAGLTQRIIGAAMRVHSSLGPKSAASPQDSTPPSTPSPPPLLPVRFALQQPLSTPEQHAAPRKRPARAENSIALGAVSRKGDPR